MLFGSPEGKNEFRPQDESIAASTPQEIPAGNTTAELTVPERDCSQVSSFISSLGRLRGRVNELEPRDLENYSSDDLHYAFIWLQKRAQDLVRLGNTESLTPESRYAGLTAIQQLIDLSNKVLADTHPMAADLFGSMCLLAGTAPVSNLSVPAFDASWGAVPALYVANLWHVAAGLLSSQPAEKEGMITPTLICLERKCSALIEAMDEIAFQGSAQAASDGAAGGELYNDLKRELAVTKMNMALGFEEIGKWMSAARRQEDILGLYRDPADDAIKNSLMSLRRLARTLESEMKPEVSFKILRTITLRHLQDRNYLEALIALDEGCNIVMDDSYWVAGSPGTKLRKATNLSRSKCVALVPDLIDTVIDQCRSYANLLDHETASHYFDALWLQYKCYTWYPAERQRDILEAAARLDEGFELAERVEYQGSFLDRVELLSGVAADLIEKEQIPHAVIFLRDAHALLRYALDRPGQLILSDIAWFTQRVGHRLVEYDTEGGFEGYQLMESVLALAEAASDSVPPQTRVSLCLSLAQGALTLGLSLGDAHQRVERARELLSECPRNFQHWKKDELKKIRADLRRAS